MKIKKNLLVGSLGILLTVFAFAAVMYVIMELGYSRDNRLERNPQNSLNQRVFLQPFLFLHPIFLKST